MSKVHMLHIAAVKTMDFRARGSNGNDVKVHVDAKDELVAMHHAGDTGIEVGFAKYTNAGTETFFFDVLAVSVDKPGLEIWVNTPDNVLTFEVLDR